MNTTRYLAAALCLACQAAPPPRPQPSSAQPDALAIVAEARRMAVQPLWPGFSPRDIPIAIYDGTDTWLFGHPAPPAGFFSLGEGIAKSSGRFEGVTGNTSIELAGIPTATVVPPRGTLSLQARAATVIHEQFHAFADQRHKHWKANEAELFTYPVADADLLARRRAETWLLHRALAAAGPANTACWARRALEQRAARFAGMTPGAAGYERRIELYEGLASYVAARAAAIPDTAVLNPADFEAAAIRDRGYETGTALGRLLDRLAPGWQNRLEAGDTTSLDEMLAAALAAATAHALCEPRAEQFAAIRKQAADDAAAVRTARAARKQAFLNAKGWRLVIEADAAPLFPHGFDPLNVLVVEPGEVLHTRWLKLGNGRDGIEVLGRNALTEAAGDHPLFNGAKRLVVTGLAVQPTVTETADTVRIVADGVTAVLPGAATTTTGRTLTVRLIAP